MTAATEFCNKAENSLAKGISNQNDAITQLLQQAKSEPFPLQIWAQTIAEKTWNLMLKQTKDLIKETWRERVWSIYSMHLDNRYPLFQNARLDADLEEFISFFNPNGVFPQFFNEYMRPFVDTSQTHWHWLGTHHQSLGSDDSVLSVFERGRIITHMFFPEANDKIQIKFSLQQMIMMPIIQKFSVKMNEQMFIDTQGSTILNEFIWPGVNNNVSQASIEFETVGNEKFTLRENGPWAWFHLLDKARISPEDLKHYHVIFSHQGNEARYLLSASSEINPFIPGIINQFRCPADLDFGNE